MFTSALAKQSNGTDAILDWSNCISAVSEHYQGKKKDEKKNENDNEFTPSADQLALFLAAEPIKLTKLPWAFPDGFQRAASWVQQQILYTLVTAWLQNPVAPP